MNDSAVSSPRNPAQLSILDLVPIPEGHTASEAIEHTRKLARVADELGYTRYWFAEHHNMPGIASSATVVIIAHIAAATSRIRVGAGGIMLPNHAPLVVAEQFGTLESLFPGRIDLGLGRAPGTDRETSIALRRHLSGSPHNFPNDVLELQSYFAPAAPGQTIQAVPGAGLKVPLWLLGSSLFSAELAAQLGLPYAFASHFAPRLMLPAIELYRSRFQPSAALHKPYVMIGAHAVVADSDDEAAHHAASLRLRFASLARGIRGPLPPPEGFVESDWSAAELAFADESLRCSAIGSPASARAQLAELQAQTGADELIISDQIFDQAARLRSYQLLAEAWRS